MFVSSVLRLVAAPLDIQMFLKGCLLQKTICYIQNSCLGGLRQWSLIYYTRIHSPKDLIPVLDTHNPEFWACLN